MQSSGLLRRAVTAMACAAFLLDAAAFPVQAVKATQVAHVAPAPAAPAFHPELDHAGSTVAAHEGRWIPRPGSLMAAVQTPGLDVSSWQGDVDWRGVAANGATFAYVKATEGTSYTNPYFVQQYDGSYDAGLIHGAYHFALPDHSSGATQADYFLNHGGGWSADGKTLPPALDIEYNPYGENCYGLSPSGMVGWIRDFSTTVLGRTGRYPVIYATANWWTTCTGDYGGFGATNPLWTAHHADAIGTLPAGWLYQTFWQYSDAGTFPGDQDLFNGAQDRLQALANG